MSVYKYPTLDDEKLTLSA